MTGPNHLARAAAMWDVLADLAAKGTTLTYGEMGRRLGIHHRALRYALEPIQDHCLEEGLPPLTILVHAADGTLGAGFVAWDPDRAAEGRAQVFAHDWHRAGNPFQVWCDDHTMASLLAQALEEPNRADDLFVRVRSRGQRQHLFRQLLLEVYDGTCAVSGSTIQEGLEACHIIGWMEASTSEAFSLRNGLLLHAWHHRLFDEGLLDIDDQYYVRVAPPLLDGAAPIDRDHLRWIDGKRIALPPKRSHWPTVELLRQRREGLTWVQGRHSDGP